MKGSSINRAMIVLAREARALNQTELAERIHTSPTNLSKIERGDIGVSEDLMESIAATTSYPKHFFLQTGDIVPHTLAYRKRETVAQKLITPINAQANIICRHVQFLTRALQIAVPRLPLFAVGDGTTPIVAASRLRQFWRFPAGPVDHLIKAVEQQGIAVKFFSFGTPRVDSRSLLTEDNQPLVCLNSDMPGDRVRFSLAYELGGLLMHVFADTGADRDTGHEANLFAAELLMPEADIRPDFQAGVTLPLLAQLKKKWKVSMIALLYRADDLGYVTPNQKRYLLQQFNAMKIRRREPVELNIPLEGGRLIQHWVAAYKAKTGIGTQEMAALLCLHLDEFIDLYL